MSTSYNKQVQSHDIHSSKQKPMDHPHWYSPKTGIYSSKHPTRTLPSEPFTDVVSYIFSHNHNGKTSFIDSPTGYSISYAELQPLVKSMACGLHHQMGVSKGDVVLILLPNSVYFHVVFLGVLYLGAVVTTMNPLSSVSEIKKQTLDCNLNLAFTMCSRVQELSALGIVSIPVPENPNFEPNHVDFLCFQRLISNNHNTLPPRTISQHDTAAILYSSGTTGASKGVVLTHKNLISGVELFVRFEASQYKNRDEENVYLAVIPMFHIYGLTLFTMGILSLGSSIVVMNKFDPNEMMQAISKYGVTHFPAVPPLMAALTKIGRSVYGGDQLKSLKQVSCGAAPLSTKRIDEFVETFPHVDFIQGYGMTESTAVGTRGFNTRDSKNYSSAGLLAPNMEAKVVDFVTGSCLPPGVTGELWLRGPAIMKEYLNNMGATCCTVDKDGWLHTGDIVYLDTEGFLHVVDRLKDIIKYKGFQIAPADLEDILACHPAIIDVAVVGAMDEEAGEIPVAYVVKKPEAEISQSDIVDFVAKQVAPHKKIRQVKFIDVIPKSAAGKILRRQLKYNFSSRL